MSDLMKYVNRLADDIGPRPANSQEEQRGAELISGWFKKAGASSRVEEFACPTWATWPYLIAFLVTALSAFLSYSRGLLVLTFILSLLSLALFVFEFYLKGALADRVRKGMSQNVVAKYVPERIAGEKRRRKVIIVAHYDSERTALETSPSVVNMYPVLQKALTVCMFAVPAIMLLELLPFMSVIHRWTWLFTCFISLLPIISAVSILLRQFVMPYNAGANGNASGVAALMGIMQNIVPGAGGAGRMEEDAPDTVTHDEQAVRENHLVDDGVDVVYHTQEAGNRAPRAADAPLGAVDQSRGGARGDDGSEPSVCSANAAAVFAEFPQPVFRIQADAADGDVAMRSEVRENEALGETIPMDEALAALAASERSEPADQTDGQPSAELPPVMRHGSEMPPLKTAGTGEANVRASAEDAVEAEQPHAEHRGRKSREWNDAPHTTTGGEAPSWWQRVESMRKPEGEASGASESAPAPKVQRSRYADVPTSDERRIEAERLAAQRAEAERLEREEQERRAAEKRAREEARRAAEEKQAMIEAGASENAAGNITAIESLVSKEVSKNRPQAARDHAVSEAAGASDAEGSVRGAGNAPVKDAVDASQKRSSNMDARLINLPDMSGGSSLDSHTRNAPRLFMDDAFGKPQEAPIKSEYADTEQRASAMREATAPAQSPAVDEAAGRDDSSASAQEGEFSPFAGGTFAKGETGAFIPVGNTGAFTALDADDEFVVDDADDSTIVNTPVVGDFDAPASIDIPESRAHRFLDRASDLFGGKRKKNQGEEVSASEWLGVDKDYDARKAGRDIGSWDNFDENDDDWRGGAVSTDTSMQATTVMSLGDQVSSMARSSRLDKEVWFVALGAHGVGNAGMKNFLAKHSAELSNSLIINLDCVGAGEICFLEKEGMGYRMQGDHRLQTLIGKIANELGESVEIESLDWADTDATPAMRNGVRAITIMGFDDTAPVSWHQRSDTSAIVEESRIDLVVDLVTEMIYAC